METLDQIKVVRDAVAKYVDRGENLVFDGLPVDEDSRNHIINIGTSIMCTKWKLGYPGGSFVQSVVNNDLYGCIASADTINIKALKFYLLMMHNMGMPKQLWNLV